MTGAEPNPLDSEPVALDRGENITASKSRATSMNTGRSTGAWNSAVWHRDGVLYPGWLGYGFSSQAPDKPF
jgi:hypothetical protein